MPAWAAITAVAVVWDVYAIKTGRDTASKAWYKVRADRRGRTALGALSAIALYHFWGQGWERG